MLANQRGSGRLTLNIQTYDRDGNIVENDRKS